MNLESSYVNVLVYNCYKLMVYPVNKDDTLFNKTAFVPTNQN